MVRDKKSVDAEESRNVKLEILFPFIAFGRFLGEAYRGNVNKIKGYRNKLARVEEYSKETMHY